MERVQFSSYDEMLHYNSRVANQFPGVDLNVFRKIHYLELLSQMFGMLVHNFFNTFIVFRIPILHFLPDNFSGSRKNILHLRAHIQSDLHYSNDHFRHGTGHSEGIQF